MFSGLVSAPFFFEPLGQGVAADLEGTSNASHRGAFLVSGQHLFLEGLAVPWRGRLREGTPARFAAKARPSAGGASEADNVLALAVGATKEQSNHALRLHQQFARSHYRTSHPRTLLVAYRPDCGCSLQLPDAVAAAQASGEEVLIITTRLKSDAATKITKFAAKRGIRLLFDVDEQTMQRLGAGSKTVYLRVENGRITLEPPRQVFPPNLPSMPEVKS